MVRGAMLELLDITYDGLEDSVTGFLTGGLGQLVDGKYGAENYRAVGENGLVRGCSLHIGINEHYILFLFSAGYEWVGWKNKSMGPLRMDFTFRNEISLFPIDLRSVCLFSKSHHGVVDKGRARLVEVLQEALDPSSQLAIVLELCLVCITVFRQTLSDKRILRQHGESLRCTSIHDSTVKNRRNLE